MGSFRCYDSSNVIATLMMTNFHLNTTDVAIFPNVCLWRRSLCSDLVLTLENCIEPPSYDRTAYVVAVWPSFHFDSHKNLGNLRDFFGQIVYRPPWQKISRTPMIAPDMIYLSHIVIIWEKIHQWAPSLRQTQNRKTVPENRNTNPKIEINIPKWKHVQKNTKLNHKTEKEFKNTNHDQKHQNRNKEIM